VLGAFQARPKSKAQLTLVLGIIIGSGILTGLGFWQLKSRWRAAQKPVILDASPKVPQVPAVRQPGVPQ
jgi:cytochrome oxidase assembly protein ShyY1